MVSFSYFYVFSSIFYLAILIHCMMRITCITTHRTNQTWFSTDNGPEMNCPPEGICKRAKINLQRPKEGHVQRSISALNAGKNSLLLSQDKQKYKRKNKDNDGTIYSIQRNKYQNNYSIVTIELYVLYLY